MRFCNILVLAGMMLSAGCSFFNTSRQVVAINVAPADAQAIINGSLPCSVNGGFPIFFDAKRDEEVLITVFRKGYISQRYVINYHMSTPGILDCIGGIFIFPLFGLFSQGAWELDEQNVYINLKPLEVNETIYDVTGDNSAEVIEMTDIPVANEAIITEIPVKE